MQLAFQTHTLANGLRVIVHYDPSITQAAVDVLYHVGAKHEQPGRTGFAHLFEHLMFRGSKHVQHYDAYVEAAGGTNNAFTSNDVTNYYLSLPANQLETALWLESDRMLELDFSEDNLALEKSIVIEEFKQRYLNQPYGDAYLHLRPLMFKEHPYRWMTIGQSIEQIEAASLQDVKAFFFNFYAPNNATLVIAGGVPPEEAFASAEKWFGSLPRRTVNKPERPAEPPQTAPRQQSLTSGNVPLAAVYRAYHIPARTSNAYFPADILTGHLSDGPNALLYRRLVQEAGVASAVGAFSWNLYDTGKLSINGHVAEGRSVADYEAALDDALAELAELPDEAVERQVRKLTSEEVFSKTTAMNRALGLALSDSLGDPGRVNSDVAQYAALDSKQVRDFANRWLVPSNRTTLHYLPQSNGA